MVAVAQGIVAVPARRQEPVIGLASVVALVLAASFWCLFGLGLEAVAILRTLVGLCVLGIAPGYLVQRLLIGTKGRRPLEVLASSLLLGSVCTPLVWYAANLLHLAPVFWVGLIVLAVTVSIRWWRSDSILDVLWEIKPSETLPLWIGLLLAMAWSASLHPVAVSVDGVTVRTALDHQFHLAWIAELGRSTPPATAPFLAPDLCWAYHYLPDMWCDLLRRVSGTDLLTAYYRIALPLRYVLISLACSLALHRRFGRIGAALAAVTMFGWVGASHATSALSCPPLTNWLASYFAWNLPSGPGLVTVFLILYAVSLAGPTTSRGPLLLAAFLAALLFWYKANFALVVLPAVLLFVCARQLKHRDFRGLAICVGMLLCMMAGFYLSTRSADLRAVLVFAPFRFIDHMWWKGSDLLVGLKPDALSQPAADCVRTLRYVIESLPTMLRQPAVFITCMIYLFHISIVVGLLATWRCRFGREKGSAGDVDRLMLLILACTFVGFVVLPVQDGYAFNVSFHNFAIVNALLLALAGPVLVDVFRLAWRARPVVRAGVLVVLVGVASLNAYAMTLGGAASQSDAEHTMSRGFHACCEHIRRHAPREAIVLHPEYTRGHMGASVVAQRRIVLDCAPWWVCQWKGKITPRVEACDAFYAGIDPARARVWLSRREVTHVIAERALPERAGYTHFLREVFAHDGMAVFRFEPVGGDVRTTRPSRSH